MYNQALTHMTNAQEDSLEGGYALLDYGFSP